ncbi:MAG TPA: hypothetical protein VKG45_05450 [Actinomycetes bacterium]|nr:hypothetical protein [Actinomycetes bacterium]
MLVRIVRLLTAALLLGVALLIVALAGQGAAAAHSLPTAAGDATDADGQPAARTAGHQPARAGEPAVPASPGPGGLVDEYVRALNLSAQELAGAELTVPGDGARTASAEGLRPEGSRRPTTPGAPSETASNLGRWWRPEQQRADRHLVVADLDDPDGQPTPPDLTLPAPVPLAEGMTVAELMVQAQPPSPTSQPVWLLMDQITENARMLTVTMTRLSDRQVSAQASALFTSAQEHAAKASASAQGGSLSHASDPAKAEIRLAAADLRKLSKLALGEADKIGQADVLVNQAKQLREDAQNAAKAAADAVGQAAVASGAAPPAVTPENVSPVSYPVSTVVDTVVKQTKELLPRTLEAMKRLQVDPRDQEEAEGLIKAAEAHAENAKTFAFDAPRSARDEMDAAIAKLHRVSDLASKYADNLDGEGERLREVAKNAEQLVDFLEAETAPRRGTQLVPEAPAPDAPVNRLADGGEEPMPSTAGVEGQDAAVRQPGGVVEDPDGGTHSQDVLHAGVLGDDGRRAVTSQAGENRAAASTAPPPIEVAGGGDPGANFTPASTADGAIAPASEQVAAADTRSSGDSATDSLFDNDMFAADLTDTSFANAGV